MTQLIKNTAAYVFLIANPARGRAAPADPAKFNENVCKAERDAIQCGRRAPVPFEQSFHHMTCAAAQVRCC
jgi:hypothetical protein